MHPLPTSLFFDLQRLAAAPQVDRLEFRSSVGSTNDLAIELAGQVAPGTSTLVLTDRQTAGRGRGDRNWWSRDGAVTFSLVVDPTQLGFAPARWPTLSLVAGLAVCDTVQAQAPQRHCGVKWPNDVYLEGRKVSGILLEVPAAVVPRTKQAVVGIGLNVNNSFVDAPTELGDRATSISDVTGRNHNLTEVLLALLARFDLLCRELSNDSSELVRRWEQRCLLTGRVVELAIGQHRRSGICRGIDSVGALQLETEGLVRSFHGGEVTRILTDMRNHP